MRVAVWSGGFGSGRAARLDWGSRVRCRRWRLGSSLAPAAAFAGLGDAAFGGADGCDAVAPFAADGFGDVGVAAGGAGLGGASQCVPRPRKRVYRETPGRRVRESAGRQAVAAFGCQGRHDRGVGDGVAIGILVVVTVIAAFTVLLVLGSR